MTPFVFNARWLVTLATALLATAAHAGDPFSHPALRDSPGAEAGWAQARAAAPLIVGHPASPRWAVVDASGAWAHAPIEVRQQKPTPAYLARTAAAGTP